MFDVWVILIIVIVLFIGIFMWDICVLFVVNMFKDVDNY